MEKKQIRFRQIIQRIPFYPFLLAVYPIIALLAVNISQVFLHDGLAPILIALIATAIIFAVLRLLTKNWQMAGVLTGIFVVWFIVYGHLYDYLRGASLLGWAIGRHRYLFVLWSSINLIALLWLAIIKKKINPNLTLILNVSSAILLSISAIQIGIYSVERQAVSRAAETGPITPEISWSNPSQPPDIYYIILDGYPRADILESDYGVDNSDFLNNLRQMGFTVADCSQSNYSRTILSLTSTFNMDYLQTLYPQLTPDQSTDFFTADLKNNFVRRQLEQLGYQTIVFRNPWERYLWEDAAIVFKPAGYGTLSPFEYLLLNTTVARPYLDLVRFEGTQNPYYTNYIDTLYALEHLQSVPAISGPKFVFAHLMIPHPPYVFGPDGELIYIQPSDTANKIYAPEDAKRGTIDAVTYINMRMLEILPRLIQESKTPPIIILASDHGAPLQDYTDADKNLEAFYFPGTNPSISPGITPVNIFRVIFNEYFNGQFAMLPDRSYFSVTDQYLPVEELSNECNIP